MTLRGGGRGLGGNTYTSFGSWCEYFIDTYSVLNVTPITGTYIRYKHRRGSTHLKSDKHILLATCLAGGGEVLHRGDI